jgi:nickel transport protein
MKNRYMLLQTFALATLITIVLAGTAFGHKVNLFAYVEDGVVYLESYFPDGKKVQNAEVIVYDSSQTKLLTGKTDNEGMFSFTPPKIDDLTIVVNASMGHRSKFVVNKEEFGE